MDTYSRRYTLYVAEELLLESEPYEETPESDLTGVNPV